MRKFIYVLMLATIAMGIIGCSSPNNADSGQLQRAQKAQEELGRNVGK